jgi:hypothetical protein
MRRAQMDHVTTTFLGKNMGGIFLQQSNDVSDEYPIMFLIGIFFSSKEPLITL